MLRVTKKQASRFLAVLLAVLMVVNIVPVGMIPAVVKAADGCKVVKLGEEKVYLYGIDEVTKVEQKKDEKDKEFYVLTYTGGDTEIVDETDPTATIPETFEVYVDGNANANYSKDVVNKDNVLTISKRWLENNKDKWIAICRDREVEIPQEEPTGEDAKFDFVGIEIKPYNRPYNGVSHKAVVVYENGEEITEGVSYSTDINDEDSWSKEVPEVEVPGKTTVWVKIKRDNYKDYISEANVAQVTNGNLEDLVTVEAKEGLVYNGKPQDLVKVKGEYDSISYSIDGVECAEPKKTDVKNDKEEPYAVHVVAKKQYYDDLDITVDVAIAKAEIKGVTAKCEYQQYKAWMWFSPIDAVTISYKGVNPEDFEVTYYPKNQNEDSEGQNTSYKIQQLGDCGIYKVRIHHKTKSVNYKDLIIPVNVMLEKGEQEIFFENEDEVFEKDKDGQLYAEYTYGEKNTFQHQIDESQLYLGSTGAITYSVEGKGTQVNPDTGLVTFTEKGDIKVTATREKDDNYKETTKSYTMHVNYADTPNYSLSKKPDAEIDDRNWYKDSFTVEAEDKAWEINKTGNKLGQDKENWVTSVTEIGPEDAVTSYDDYKVAFRNSEGEITEYKSIDKNISIDNKAPEVTNFTFSKINDSMFARIINKLTFGMFCNESVQVTVEGTDEGAGVKSFELYQYNEKDLNGSGQKVKPDKVDEKTGTTTFTLDVGFSGTVKAKAFDKVGNSSEEILANTSNSNIGDGNETGYIMLETNEPAVSDIEDKPIAGVRQDLSEKLYSGDVEFKFTAQDSDAGLSSVSVKINGKPCDDSVIINDNQKPYEGYPIYFEGRHCEEDTYTVSTVGKETDEDGRYVVEVEVVDNAGNVTTKTTTVTKDTNSATIKGFEFSLDKNIDVDDEEGIYKAVQATDYGFYFKEPVKVTISAEDVKAEKEVAAGVDTITYRTVEVDGTTKNYGPVAVDEDGKISFTINGDFKGQIYAYATDKIGNKPANSVVSDEYRKLMNEEGFVHPNGTIIESGEMHKEESEINFTMPAAVGTQSNAYSYAYTGDAAADKNMDYDAAKKVPLYSNDFSMGINVTDTYSGIRQVKWTLIEGGNADEKVIDVDNEGNITGDTEGWTLTKEEDSNLVTGLSNGVIPVSGNYNTMVMLVELTDRAGNRSYDYYAFGIDKTAPTIEVTYDNNDADTSSNDGNAYFKTDRTATIAISERNFNADQVVTVVTKEGQKIAVNSNWVATAGTGNGDDIVHKITVPYQTDGDYTFAIQCTDRATQPNTPVDYKGSTAPEKFTVDKTVPTISVSYNNNAARNGKYFKENRTATVVVTEHNFDVSKVRFTQTASLSGSAIANPTAAWTHNGDVHTATIAYQTDGDYTFDVTMDDMAGNKSGEANYGASVAGKDFTVDTKITKPAITGVENGKAYKDKVIPGINFEDINFDTDEIKLTRTRKNEKDVDVTEEFIKYITKSATGISGVNDTFENKQENDGIYTLFVKTTDKAGNEESETVTFTVNRYGSVYVFSDYLMDLIANGGAYVQDVEKDLIITEYNPDKLVEKSLVIEVTRDGKPVSDVKFTVSPVINDQVEVGESGWYQYEYKISKENFKEDGVYKMAVSSKDATGNTPENTNYDELGILFRVDTTAPEITSIVGLEENIINAQEAAVKYDVYDTIGLKSVSVYVDGEMVGSKITDFNGDLNNYAGDFKLQESNDKQKVRLVVEDLAGNVTDTDSKEFTSEYTFEDTVTVSTNMFVRWYANKALFWGSICGAVAVIGGFFVLIFFKKKKEEEN